MSLFLGALPSASCMAAWRLTSLLGITLACSSMFGCDAVRRPPGDRALPVAGAGGASSSTSGVRPEPPPDASPPDAPPPVAPSAGGPTSTGTPTGAPDAGGTAGSDAVIPVLDAGPSVSRLTLDFTTITNGGRYAPHNAGVAWVADAKGKWVHTLELWISTSFFSDLKRYAASGGPNYTNFFGTPLVPVPPDVITSATLRMPQAHAESWDLKDVNGDEVPDGNYSVVIEVAESNEEVVFELPFVKSATPRTLTPPDAGLVADAKLELR